LKTKHFVIALLVLASIFAMSFSLTPVLAESGPRMLKLHCVNYGDPYSEFTALETGAIDIVDWPLTKYWVDRWATNPSIVMRDFSEIGEYGYAFNCQRWPTGLGVGPDGKMGSLVEYGPPKTGAAVDDYLTEYDGKTKSYKHYFNLIDVYDREAWAFRLALSYLTDKSYIQTEILKGYGEMFDTYMPQSLKSLYNKGNLTASSFTIDLPGGSVTIPSLIYTKNVDKAIELLNAAGFTENPVTHVRIDPKGDWSTTGAAGGDLKPLIFYIRLDDPNRKAAGEHLAADMQAIGIPVEARVVEKTVAFKSVMVEYNFHLYTEGYSFGADGDFLYGVFSSHQFWAPVGWSGGYQAACFRDLDFWLDRVLYSPKLDPDGRYAIGNATYLINKYQVTEGLWAAAGVKAYSADWSGVVNMQGYGVDHGVPGYGEYSFLNMYKAGDDTINYGFKSSPEAIHIICSEWVWDWQLLNCIYDPLIGRNPYDLSKEVGWIAESWSLGLWDGDKTYVDFAIRSNAKFHDGTSVTADDVVFSLEFIRDCGPGTAWNYATVMDIKNVTKIDNLHVRVYFRVQSWMAAHWAGIVGGCVLNSKLWWAANDAYGWGYRTAVFNPDPAVYRRDNWESAKVREYHPWTDDANNNGIKDLVEDGAGPWKYKSGDLLTGVFDLDAWPQYYLTQDAISTFLGNAFWAKGDVNRDTLVDTKDMGLIARALGFSGDPNSTPLPPPQPWDVYNSAADLDKNTKVELKDLAIAGDSYGNSAG